MCVCVNGGSVMCTPHMGLTYVMFPKCNIFHLTCPVQYILQTISLRLLKYSDVSSVNAASCYVRLFFFFVTTVGISASMLVVEGHIVAGSVRHVCVWYPGYA
jgi:hypothetical protein